MMRVGILHGGLELESERAIPPSQKLRILRANEMGSPYSSSAFSETEHDNLLNYGVPATKTKTKLREH